MSTETITLRCPACGKEISVPAELEEFSCVYCGAKHRLPELLPQTAPADEADRLYAEEHLLDCVRDFPNAFKHFNRKQYESFYQTHKEALTPVFEAMDRWVCAHPMQRQTFLEDFVQQFLQQWEAFHRDHPKAGSKHARDRLAFSNKLTLAWFTVPAIRGMDLSIGEDFSALLRDRFNEKYPENRFEVGSFEEIRSGFRKRWFLFGKK